MPQNLGSSAYLLPGVMSSGENLLELSGKAVK